MRFPGVLLLLGVAIVACSNDTEGTCGGILQPPKAYDHFPGTPVILAEAPINRIGGDCHAMGAESMDDLACTHSGGGVRIVVLPIVDGVRITYRIQACLLHHEFGHINGADPNHIGWVRI